MIGLEVNQLEIVNVCKSVRVSVSRIDEIYCGDKALLPLYVYVFEIEEREREIERGRQTVRQTDRKTDKWTEIY